MRLASFLEIIFYLTIIFFQKYLGYSNYSFYLYLKLKQKKGMKEKKTTLVGWGPANEEEAITRIEAIEADIEKNGLIDEEEMIEHLKAKGLWLI